MTRAVFVGEAMLELSQDGSHWRLGYGGDTLNTAIPDQGELVEGEVLLALGDLSGLLVTSKVDEVEVTKLNQATMRSVLTPIGVQLVKVK